MVVERCVYLATRDPGRGGKSSHTHQRGGEERSCRRVPAPLHQCCTAHTNIYEKPSAEAVPSPCPRVLAASCRMPWPDGRKPCRHQPHRGTDRIGEGLDGETARHARARLGTPAPGTPRRYADAVRRRLIAQAGLGRARPGRTAAAAEPSTEQHGAGGQVLQVLGRSLDARLARLELHHATSLIASSH